MASARSLTPAWRLRMRAADQARGVHDRGQDDADDDQHNRKLHNRPPTHRHGAKPTRYVRISATVRIEQCRRPSASLRSALEKMVIATVPPPEVGCMLEMPPLRCRRRAIEDDAVAHAPWIECVERHPSVMYGTRPFVLALPVSTWPSELPSAAKTTLHFCWAPPPLHIAPPFVGLYPIVYPMISCFCAAALGPCFAATSANRRGTGGRANRSGSGTRPDRRTGLRWRRRRSSPRA